jgi:hypothetical protein
MSIRTCKSNFVSLNVFFVLLFLTSCAAVAGNTSVLEAHSDTADLYHWTRITENAEFPVGYNFPVFVAKDKMWAFHAEGNWYSTDGISWFKSSLESLRKNVYQSHYVQFNGAVYALGNNAGNYQSIRFDPRIRRTTDYKKWEDLGQANMPRRMFPGVVVFKEKIWLIGGYDGREYHNDIWNSKDGTNWVKVSEKSSWSPRNVSTITVFKDKLFLIGGGVIDGDQNPNLSSHKEIWSSENGSDWTRVSTSGVMTHRGFPIEFDGKLWLIGANRDGTFSRSSLVSADGANWKEQSAPWTPRGGSTAWIFQNRLFVTGGKYSVTANGQIQFIYSNDVWAMEKKMGAGS